MADAAQGDPQASGRRPRAARPLDPAQLEELALAYVARFATSAAKLERYLRRKLRERGFEGEGEPGIAAIVARHTALGYVDDAAFARSKAGGLLRRGYGPRRVSQALSEAGIAAGIREDIAPGPGARRLSALALARKRRFGPFGAAPPDRTGREKQIAAMLRAGHMLEEARELVDAQSEDAAERWAAECDDDDG